MEKRQENGSSEEGTPKPINRLIISLPDRKIVACSQQQEEEEKEKDQNNLGSKKVDHHQTMLVKNHHSSKGTHSVLNSDSPSPSSCSVRGKSSGSMKCHRDKEWRGMIQPCSGKSTVKKTPFSSSSLSTGSNGDKRSGSALTSASSDFELVRFLPNWNVPRKTRRRQNNNNNSDHRDLLSDPDAADAVDALMMLKDGVWSEPTSKKADSGCRNQDSERKQRTRVQESDVTTNRDLESTKKLKQQLHEEGDGMNGFEGLFKGLSLNKADLDCRKQVCYERKRRRDNSDVNMDLEAKKLKLHGDLDIDNIHSAVSRNGSEVLEVHESSRKNSNINDQCSSFASNLIQVHEVPESNETRSKNHIGKYQCEICGMVLSNDQALDGHQKTHWMGSVITGTVPINFMAPPQNINVEHSSTHSVASASVSAEAASVKEHTVLDFDLNETPSVDDDELSAGHQS